MKKKRSKKLRVVPLTWRQNQCRNNGWHGYSQNGDEVCYVYQPADMRIRRGPSPWQVHCYLGGKENPLKGRARFGRFHSSRSAKLAAQAWWVRQVHNLIRP